MDGVSGAERGEASLLVGGGSTRAWRFANASVIGTSHRRIGTPCQDASACELVEQAGASSLVAVVSDGAGSAPLSAIGSRTACAIVVEETRAALAGGAGLAALDHGFALEVVRRLQVQLARVARHVQRPVRDFACTLLFAVVDETRAIFAQIGDGAIVVSPDVRAAEAGASSYGWVFWPQQGEYLNQTQFATESRAAQNLQFEAWDRPVEELALFTDGLQGLVLDGRRRIAHARFFEPMFVAVRWAGPGRSDALAGSLARFLGSRAVEGRTDDDKSLVLASRRAPVTQSIPPALPSRASAPSVDASPTTGDPA